MTYRFSSGLRDRAIFALDFDQLTAGTGRIERAPQRAGQDRPFDLDEGCWWLPPGRSGGSSVPHR